MHIRQYYTSYPKKLFPSKVGVTLNIKEYLDILATADKVKGYIKELEKGKEKDNKKSIKELSCSSNSSTSDESDNEPRKKKNRKEKY